MERFRIGSAVYLFLIKNDQILLMHRQNSGYMDGQWGVPSGHVEADESFTQALVRETKEEIGIELEIKELEMVHTMHRQEDGIRVDLFFVCKNFTGEPKNTEPHLCSEIGWFPLEMLPTETIYYVKTAIENYLNKTYFSEVGFEK